MNLYVDMVSVRGLLHPQVWVRFAATRRCTALSLSGEEVDDALAAGTYTALATILTSSSHVGRLRQLGSRTLNPKTSNLDPET